MALTYLRHDEHGVMEVYDSTTLETNLKNGWTVIDDYPKYHADLIAKKRGTAAPSKPAPAEPSEDNSWLESKVPAHPHKGKGR